MGGLSSLSFDGSILSWGGGVKKSSVLSICNYESYVSGGFDFDVSLDLASFGVFFDGRLFVPAWFGGVINSSNALEL